jgi:inorganic pyrophosphatase
MRIVILACMVPIGAAAQTAGTPPRELPAEAVEQLVQSLDAARRHTSHVWRDMEPVNEDWTVNAYVEIPRGALRKWEFDMKANERALDRVMPDEIGSYPANYGFVPKTVSYDGGPFDVLVLGPPLPGGQTVRGVTVGVMSMEGENGLNSKVVVSPVDGSGRPRYALSATDRKRIGSYFARCKQHEPGTFSRVMGWGSPAEGLAHVQTTNAFFRRCATAVGRCLLR